MTNSAQGKPMYKERPAPRVTILDAVDLDTEIHRILKEQLLKIFQILSPPSLKWEPELDTFLRIVIWKLSVWQTHASFGQQLLSIKYEQEFTPRRAAAWAVLSIATHYLQQRAPELTSLLVRPPHRDKVSRVVGWLELVVEVASLINFLAFLQEGQFPTLADRLVRATPVSATITSRVVGYSHMTRELLWHGFIELIVFILPLVNFKYIQRCVRKLVGLQRSDHNRREALVYTVATRCAVCQEPPVLPYHMGCPHAFCYYCLQSNRMEDTKFECPTCGYSTEDSEAVQPVTSRFCADL